MRLRLLALATAAAGLAAPAARAQTTIHLGLRAGANLATRAGDDPTYQFNNGNTSGSSSVTSTSQVDYNRQAIVAPQFGAVLDVRFGKLAVQPAVLFSQKGVEQTLNATTITSYSFGGYSSRSTSTEKLHSISRANYLEIPVNLVYTPGGDHGFQFFAGPYVAFGVGGRAEIENQGSNNNGGNGSNSTNNYYTYGNTFFIYRDTYPGGPNSYTNPNTGTTTTTTSPASYEANNGAIVARRFDAGLNAGIGYRFSSVQVQLGYGLGLLNQQTGKSVAFSTEPTAYRQRVAQLTATYFFKAGSF